jgi:hypothetical protein
MNGEFVYGDSKFLSGFPWATNENLDNNLESLCILHEDMRQSIKNFGRDRQ